MARQNISIGAAANDGTGDTLRQAAQKINQTFVELYRQLGGDSDNVSSIIKFDGNTLVFDRGNEYILSAPVSSPASNRTVLMPDANGTITLNEATQTVSNKTITASSLVSPNIGGTVGDSNGNLLFAVASTNNAVNGFAFTNSTAGNPPTIGPSGTDTNIPLNLIGKGTGSVQLTKASYASVTVTDGGGVASGNVSYIICDRPGGVLATIALSLDSGSNVGEYKLFTNRGFGTATVTPSSFAQGTAFTVPSRSAAQCIWDGEYWFLLGRDSDIEIIS